MFLIVFATAAIAKLNDKPILMGVVLSSWVVFSTVFQSSKGLHKLERKLDDSEERLESLKDQIF